MSLPRYPEYKHSGVAWLSEMPAQWSWSSLKWISKRYSGGTPDKTRHDFWQDGTVPWLNSGAVNDQRITEPSAYITEQAFNNSSAKWIPAGALVMALAGQGKTKGMVAQVTFETTCNQSMAAIVPSLDVDSRFLYWWLVSNYQNIRNMAGGDNRDGLNLELLGTIPCPLPSGHEQHAISTFLDRETAKIDALIAEQEKLLALLAEKRQATISHAVTRGLNPNAPMKDSGIPWLGEVPVSWKVCAIKRMTVLITDGAHVSPETEGGVFDFVSTKDVRDDGIDFDGALKTSASSYEYLVRTGCRPRRGDVLFSKDGTIGRTVVIHEEREFVVASSLIIIRPAPQILDGLFLHYLCQSFVVRQQVDGFVKGAGLPRLSIQNLTKVFGVFPSLLEQRAIAQFLKAADDKWFALKEDAEGTVALLRERRSALISAAVTGKIDVRHAA